MLNFVHEYDYDHDSNVFDILKIHDDDIWLFDTDHNAYLLGIKY